MEAGEPMSTLATDAEAFNFQLWLWMEAGSVDPVALKKEYAYWMEVYRRLRVGPRA